MAFFRYVCGAAALGLILGGDGFTPATPPLRGAVDWFSQAYDLHMEFGIHSRRYPRKSGDRDLKRYVLLTAQQGGPLHNTREIKLPESEVLAAAHDALTKAGFTAARSSEEAELAIVVVYGNGEYPPPFEFMGIDPVAVPSFRWPSLLQQYEQRYFRRNYTDAADLGYVLREKPEEADLVNFIGIRAFDARELRTNKTWTLCWETRVTIDSLRRPLEKHFRAMILVASESLGRNDRNGSRHTAPVRSGIVDLGELEVIETVESPEPPAPSPPASSPTPDSR